MGRDPDSTDKEDRLRAWIEGRDASSVETWLQSRKNSDEACSDNGGSAENWMPAGASGSDESLSDESRQPVQLRHGAKTSDCKRGAPGTGRRRPIDSGGGEALRREPQQAPKVEGGNASCGVLQQRQQGGLHSARRRPPQRHGGSDGGEQSGRRAQFKTSKFRSSSKFLGDGADIPDPAAVGVSGAA